MGKHVWFPFYFDDYLADTHGLTTEEHGAYLLILIELYRAGGELPYDEKMLRRITGLSAYKWKNFCKIFDKYFEKISQKFHHPRVTEQLARQALIAAQATEKAGKAAHSRWHQRTNMGHASSIQSKVKDIPQPPSQDDSYTQELDQWCSDSHSLGGGSE